MFYITGLVLRKLFFLVLKVETKKNSIICHVIDEEGKLDMFWFGPNELLDLIKIS
jgi:hypothetical protein